MIFIFYWFSTHLSDNLEALAFFGFQFITFWHEARTQKYVIPTQNIVFHSRHRGSGVFFTKKKSLSGQNSAGFAILPFFMKTCFLSQFGSIFINFYRFRDPFFQKYHRVFYRFFRSTLSDFFIKIFYKSFSPTFSDILIRKKRIFWDSSFLVRTNFLGDWLVKRVF